MKEKIDKRSAFTLVEFLIAMVIMTAAIFSLLAAHFSIIVLNETSRNVTLATQESQAKLEELKNIAFDALSVYDDTSFDVFNFASNDAKGHIDVDSTVYNDLMRVHISVSWKQRTDRVVGEDMNLNGMLDTGEDKNGNGELNSPADLITFISEW
ncbi:MAG: hypothetical protein P9L96_01810 [Candidatus Gygaella obscura]|nr:hypothetical protein [Candidatus Gygaella obscura]